MQASVDIQPSAFNKIYLKKVIALPLDGKVYGFNPVKTSILFTLLIEFSAFAGLNVVMKSSSEVWFVDPSQVDLPGFDFSELLLSNPDKFEAKDNDGNNQYDWLYAVDDSLSWFLNLEEVSVSSIQKRCLFGSLLTYLGTNH